MRINEKNGEVVSVNFEIRFIDSFKFLQTSLANLVANLQLSDFKNTNSIIKNNTYILRQKGVYPYDYVSSISKFRATRLPPKEEFCSKLINNENNSDAINVWNTFNCKTVQDHDHLYLKSDVLLLADIFENFRKTCLKY